MFETTQIHPSNVLETRQAAESHPYNRPRPRPFWQSLKRCTYATNARAKCNRMSSSWVTFRRNYRTVSTATRHNTRRGDAFRSETCGTLADPPYGNRISRVGETVSAISVIVSTRGSTSIRPGRPANTTALRVNYEQLSTGSYARQVAEAYNEPVAVVQRWFSRVCSCYAEIASSRCSSFKLEILGSSQRSDGCLGIFVWKFCFGTMVDIIW